MTDEAPDPRKLLQLARRTLSASERYKKYRKIDFLDQMYWYPTQLKFFQAGASGVHQRLIYGGNQSGKTLCGGAEVTWHATGIYPAFWNGLRFKKPPLIWVVCESVIVGRDTCQKKLLGDGLIPLEYLARKPIMVPGGTGAVDTLFVTHHDAEGNPDGVAQIVFKTFEQRREKLQGASVDLNWIDEKPPSDVYSELLARTSATDGHIIVSYTPVGASGAEGITYKYLSEHSPDRASFRIASDEVKHISAQRRAELAEEYSEAERDSRIEGLPQLGAGPVYPLEMLRTIIKPFSPDDIPSWARWSVGIDFGFAGAFAAVMIAWLPDLKNLYVVDSFSVSRTTPLYHVNRIHEMTRGLRMLVNYPHDGGQQDRAGSGLSLAQQYRSFGANMAAKNVVNYGTTNYSVEPGIEEIRTLMFSGKLYIHSCNQELVEQIRGYHRDDNLKVVKVRDHLCDALRYAVMGKRSGKPRANYDGVGVAMPGAGMPYAGQRREHPNGGLADGIDFDLF